MLQVGKLGGGLYYPGPVRGVHVLVDDMGRSGIPEFLEGNMGSGQRVRRGLVIRGPPSRR